MTAGTIVMHLASQALSQALPVDAVLSLLAAAVPFDLTSAGGGPDLLDGLGGIPPLLPLPFTGDGPAPGSGSEEPDCPS